LDADAVVVDLEDAVPEDRRPFARAQTREVLLHAWRPNVFVRINGTQTEWFEEDIDSLKDLPVAGIVLPMTAGPEDVVVADRLLAGMNSGRWIVPILETAAGIANAFSIAGAAKSVLAVAFGGGDYSLDMGFPWPGRNEMPFLVPRTTTVAAARLAGLRGAIDTPNPALQDLEEFRADAEAGAALGFRAKFAIHPAQVPLINAVYSVNDDALNNAREIVAAFDTGLREGKAAVTLNGKFIDYAIALRAEAVIRRAEADTDVGRGPTSIGSHAETGVEPYH
jgi:citrate lyase subunit beta/citryl-CoA lyase